MKVRAALDYGQPIHSAWRLIWRACRVLGVMIALLVLWLVAGWAWSAYRLGSVTHNWPEQKVLVLVDGEGADLGEGDLTIISHIPADSHDRGTKAFFPSLQHLGAYRNATPDASVLDCIPGKRGPVLFAGWLTAANGMTRFVTCHAEVDYETGPGFSVCLITNAFTRTDFALLDWKIRTCADAVIGGRIATNQYEVPINASDYDYAIVKATHRFYTTPQSAIATDRVLIQWDYTQCSDAFDCNPTHPSKLTRDNYTTVLQQVEFRLENDGSVSIVG